MVLAVEGLKVHFFTRAGVVKAVDGVSFSVGRGEVLGLVGESGSGKTVTGLALLGLVDPPGRIVEGSIKFQGEELTGRSEQELRAVRGRRAAMIFQDPMMTLNPVLRVDTQMIEAITAHERVSQAAARARARDALVLVGIASPEERLNAYPHQFSGGMRQRVAIAIALLHRPALLIADEPTTALDVTIQSQVLDVLRRLQEAAGMSILLITHDLGVVADIADRVVVMYAGRVIEQAPTEQLFAHHGHHYTHGLLDAVPNPARHAEGGLREIPGRVPTMRSSPDACTFADRCGSADDTCRTARPELAPGPAGHLVRCWHPLQPANAVLPADIGDGRR